MSNKFRDAVLRRVCCETAIAGGDCVCRHELEGPLVSFARLTDLVLIEEAAKMARDLLREHEEDSSVTEKNVRYATIALEDALANDAITSELTED